MESLERERGGNDHVSEAIHVKQKKECTHKFFSISAAVLKSFVLTATSNLATSSW